VDTLRFGFRLALIKLGPIPQALSEDFSGAFNRLFFENLAKLRVFESDVHLVLIDLCFTGCQVQNLLLYVSRHINLCFPPFD
jgi:hypothetical protein